ncbi:hypothetical protein P152DRAFT_447597 [Eremomyces bilateralis CBS 781.70]|uniref:Uncharacterized protein n=1 Tax=Eremomyces bilateralis CBS 781.70 TaxID=1392243 RepID=A0A6G1G8H3_9PEZI|nr:uncharacterized protein P152DRAFT_447597 [Eremomyces bilateralis CBS 781.70]KAF1814200.1 hypothetical protein P152DRAFT_447597 [Eremomyces bilateralis CBS 781.70]
MTFIVDHHANLRVDTVESESHTHHILLEVTYPKPSAQPLRELDIPLDKAEHTSPKQANSRNPPDQNNHSSTENIQHSDSVAISEQSLKRNLYYSWLSDRVPERTDPFGFSSAGCSRAASREPSPSPPLPSANYEVARRNSIHGKKTGGAKTESRKCSTQNIAIIRTKEWEFGMTLAP